MGLIKNLYRVLSAYPRPQSGRPSQAETGLLFTSLRTIAFGDVRELLLPEEFSLERREKVESELLGLRELPTDNASPVVFAWLLVLFFVDSLFMGFLVALLGSGGMGSLGENTFPPMRNLTPLGSVKVEARLYKPTLPGVLTPVSIGMLSDFSKGGLLGGSLLLLRLEGLTSASKYFDVVGEPGICGPPVLIPWRGVLKSKTRVFKNCKIEKLYWIS